MNCRLQIHTQLHNLWQLPDTELIFGIDIQKKFSLSYAWDKDKHCYIQQNGKFLVFTHANTCTAMIGAVKSTLKIPPRHNGVVPIKISGTLITTHTAYFIMDDSTPKGRDPNINIIDGIHKIKDKTSVNILISNCTNKHLTFHKGEYIGHLEPAVLDPTDQKYILTKPTVSHWRKWCWKPLHLTPLIHLDMNFLYLYKTALICYYKNMSHNLPKMKQQ